MRFKFKPNVNAPHSTASVDGSSTAGVCSEGGESGAGGEVRSVVD